MNSDNAACELMRRGLKLTLAMIWASMLVACTSDRDECTTKDSILRVSGPIPARLIAHLESRTCDGFNHSTQNTVYFTKPDETDRVDVIEYAWGMGSHSPVVTWRQDGSVDVEIDYVSDVISIDRPRGLEVRVKVDDTFVERERRNSIPPGYGPSSAKPVPR